MRKTIKSSQGKRFTNGVEIFGTVVYLAEGNDGSEFYQITDEEAEKKQAEQEGGI